MTPVPSALVEMLKPGGREEPEAAAQLQVYGDVPPEAVRENPLLLPP
jgi:hypothetical protein